YVPDFDAADKLIARLSRIGNLASDGRPILGLDSRHLLEIVLESSPQSYLIPAHIWTPWFAVLGSKSGFDTIEDCYGDLTKHIFALETGLSSDPPMNWRLSQLDRYTLVSNSDAHSPPKIGREACAFACELDYFAMRRALETRDRYAGTVEFFPEEGKYHFDGHRACGVRLTPPETKQLAHFCPTCGKELTIGVMHRVDELADRPEDFQPDAPQPKYRSLVPLPEILGEITGKGVSSKAVQAAYHQALAQVGSELFILDQAPVEELRRIVSPLLAEAIARMRSGQVIRDAGYDGEYGVIRMFQPGELKDRASPKRVT
ncbi:MAG TPA: endonuclease Q family protein, partial [Planctomycetaceae bacterium]|nr:endonuclease Q family protein [Planctomycetaceae bacterium]